MTQDCRDGKQEKGNSTLRTSKQGAVQVTIEKEGFHAANVPGSWLGSVMLVEIPAASTGSLLQSRADKRFEMEIV